MEKKDVAEIFKFSKELCKIAIKKIEAKEPEENYKNDLEEIKGYYDDVLFPYIKFRLINSYDKLYGAYTSQMEFKVDFKCGGNFNGIIRATDIKLTNGVKDDFCSFYLNPLLCADYKFSELLGVVVQEVLRLIYNHPTYFSNNNEGNDPGKHEMLNNASDVETSELLVRDIYLDGREGKGLMLPRNSYSLTQMNNDLKISPESEQNLDYYFKLEERFRKNNPAPSGGEGQGNSSNNGGDAPVTPNSNNGKSPHAWENNQSPQEIEQMLKTMASNAVSSLPDSYRGNTPGKILQQIEKLLAPPQINWKQIFRKMIGSIPGEKRETRRRLNRRQPERADLPGQIEDLEVEVVVGIDTSGSVSDNDVKYVLNEILNMTKGRKAEITIIECDYNIQRIYKIKDKKDIKEEVAGRGGTSFVPVINYLNGEVTDGFKANKSYKRSLMVYFTDGYGDCEIPKPRTYKNLWVVFNREENLSLKQPYGQVVSINTDKDYEKMKKWR